MRRERRPEPSWPETTTGFHPLFLYESIWNAMGGAIALWLSHRRASVLRPGDLASFWMVWYGAVRLALETFREGWNWTVAGIPTAMLIGVALIVLGVATAWWRHRGPLPGPDRLTAEAPPAP